MDENKNSFLQTALTLCGLYNFSEGYIYCCEKLGQFQALIWYHVENNDM